MTQHDDSDAMPHRGEVTDVSACYQRLTPRSAKLYRNSLLWSKTVVGRVTDLLHLTLLLNFTEIASFWKKKFYFRFFNVAWTMNAPCFQPMATKFSSTNTTLPVGLKYYFILSPKENSWKGAPIAWLYEVGLIRIQHSMFDILWLLGQLTSEHVYFGLTGLGMVTKTIVAPWLVDARPLRHQQIRYETNIYSCDMQPSGRPPACLVYSRWFPT